MKRRRQGDTTGHNAFDLISASPSIWRGQSCKNEAILGFALAAVGQKSNQLPINTDRARSCLSCIRQLQAEISVCAREQESFGNRADSRKAARLTAGQPCIASTAKPRYK